MYNIKQGLKNICRNIRLSLASMATVSACIFLFCVFFAVVANLDFVIKNIETKVGITVFFEESLKDEQIENIGKQITSHPNTKSIEFTSADAAWAQFKDEYFEGREELAEGFADDNPLKGSSSYTIFINDIEKQDEYVAYLQSIEGVRQVNYSSQTGSSLKSLNKLISIVSGILVLLLLIIGMFLISNTIAVSAEFRKNETKIMKLIGATNHMVRAPFVVEGVVIGLAGAAIPLIIVYFLYNKAIEYLQTHFGIISELFAFIPIKEIFPYMAGVGLLLGVGMGFIASRITIRKYLRV